MDVVESDLIVSNMLIQHNVIRAGALSVQHVETGFQRFVVGANESASMSVLAVLGDYYDVIFVGGDTVRANMIFQENVVIDDDAMRVIGTGADGAAATLGGWNTLWSEAWIHRSGSDVFTSVTDGAWDFLDILTGHKEVLEDPPGRAVLWAVNGSGRRAGTHQSATLGPATAAGAVREPRGLETLHPTNA